MNRTSRSHWSAAAALLSGCAPLALDRDARRRPRIRERHAGAAGALPCAPTRNARRARAEARIACCEQPISAPTTRCASRSPTAPRCRRFCSRSPRATRPRPRNRRACQPGVHVRAPRAPRRAAERERKSAACSPFPCWNSSRCRHAWTPPTPRQQQLRLKAARDVLQAAAEARQAWVRAVAARQALAYYEQVKDAADAGAELARRMQAAGNFSRCSARASTRSTPTRTAQLARATQQAPRDAREALVRALGLDAAQAAALKLPERLPDLPAGAATTSPLLTRVALDERLDVRMARAELDARRRAQRASRGSRATSTACTSAAVRNSRDRAERRRRATRSSLPLPLFDFGDARRACARAGVPGRAATAPRPSASQAASQVREGYGAYRTAYDLARHYRDEIVPLRKTISDEMLLQVQRHADRRLRAARRFARADRAA